MSALHRRYGALRPLNSDLDELKKDLETLKALYTQDMKSISADIQTLSDQISSAAASGV